MLYVCTILTSVRMPRLSNCCLPRMTVTQNPMKRWGKLNRRVCLARGFTSESRHDIDPIPRILGREAHVRRIRINTPQAFSTSLFHDLHHDFAVRNMAQRTAGRPPAPPRPSRTYNNSGGERCLHRRSNWCLHCHVCLRPRFTAALRAGSDTTPPEQDRVVDMHHWHLDPELAHLAVYTGRRCLALCHATNNLLGCGVFWTPRGPHLGSSFDTSGCNSPPHVFSHCCGKNSTGACFTQTIRSGTDLFYVVRSRIKIQVAYSVHRFRPSPFPSVAWLS